MERFDLRSQIITALQQRSGTKLNTRTDPARFNCIREKHSSPQSAWLGDHAWGCYSCGLEPEPLESLAGDLGIEVPKRGFTLADYAARKQFSEDRLRAWGVADALSRHGNPVVAIPYRAADGTLLRTKYRHDKGTFWHDDDARGEKTYLYGLEQMAKRPKDPVILVEGESDCHAAWHHGVLAIGIPGASAWRTGWTDLLAGRQVYVWQEPGEAAAKMIVKLAADLPGARVLQRGGSKDIADLHKHVGKGFRDAITARIASSYPIDRTPPVVEFDVLLGDTLDRIEYEKLKPIDAVPSPIPTWNALCRDAGGGVGLARGWHVTIGATTGNGKSLLALNLAAQAIRCGERVAFLSLEMSQTQLATRFLSIVSGVGVRELEQGSSFSVASWRAAGSAVALIHQNTGGSIFVNRARFSKLPDLLSAMKYEHEVHGCRYVIVDYMQLAWVDGSKKPDEKIAEVSHSIRDAAVEMNLVSVALSQFNRETSKNREVPPTPQGLMGGSAIENDSDQVILLDHSTREKTDDGVLTRLLVAKNRHGGMDAIDVKWDYRVLRIREVQTPQSASAADGQPVMVYAPRAGRSGPSEASEPADVSESDTDFPFGISQ